MIFKVINSEDGEQDAMYIEAADLDAAKAYLKDQIGDIPEENLTWTEAETVPEGEELL